MSFSISDFASSSIVGVTGDVISGTFNPEQALANLYSQVLTGEWKLKVVDDLGGDLGTLNSFDPALIYDDDRDGRADTTIELAGHITLRKCDFIL